MNERIIKFNHSDLKWSFDDTNKPFISLPTKKWAHSEYVDPFPCYSHDEKLVTKMVEHCEGIVNLRFKPQYFIMPFEGYSRTNGYACANEDYQSDKEAEKKLNPYIVLYGKRIYPHPAMTRYLVSHELGHILEYTLHAILKQESEDFQKEYAKVRGIEYNKKYGALNHHTNIAEIIANDIRVGLFCVEPEFWVHDMELPTSNQKVMDFWKEMKEKYLS